MKLTDEEKEWMIIALRFGEDNMEPLDRDWETYRRSRRGGRNYST